MACRSIDRARAEALDASLRRMFQSLEPRALPDSLKVVIAQLEEGPRAPNAAGIRPGPRPTWSRAP